MLDNPLSLSLSRTQLHTNFEKVKWNISLCSHSVGRSTAMSAPFLKLLEHVLKGPNASFITQRTEAREVRERKGNEWDS